MPGNEIVWRANVWEHTRCLAVCGFLLRPLLLGSQRSLSAMALLCVREGATVPASLCVQPLSSGAAHPVGAVALLLEQPRNFAGSRAGRSLSRLEISPARVKRNTTFSRILKQPHGPCPVHRDSTHHSLLPLLT